MPHPCDHFALLLQIIIQITTHQSIDESAAIHVLEYVLFLYQFEH